MASGYQFGSMTKIEREVMSLWDDGVSLEAICDRLNKSRNIVSGIVSRLDGAADERSARRAMRDGSNALLAAMRGAA